MVPALSFHLRYSLTRRQRLSVELYPWLPAIAGTIGFVIGALYLVVFVSSWFLLLFIIPVVMYRGLFAFAFDIAMHALQPIELVVEDSRLGLTIDGVERWLTLDGIIQVFRSESGSTWTVLHLDRTVITIPADVISIDQLDYLKSFALRAAAERKAAEASN